MREMKINNLFGVGTRGESGERVKGQVEGSLMYFVYLHENKQ
jgi:hypothetical protein